MKLYHYTAEDNLGSILENGLTRGELPLSPSKVVKAISLTTDPCPRGHGLSDDEQISELHRVKLAAAGVCVPPGARYKNKRAIRITLQLPSNSVTSWLPWARRKLEQSWFDVMVETGGGIDKARTWWFSIKPIPPAKFVTVEYSDGADGWLSDCEFMNMKPIEGVQ